MDCLFIRHGIALEPEQWEGAESQRPLTAKGKRRVRQAASGLALIDVAPTHMLSSPFTRAKETALIIRRLLCRTVPIQYLDELAVGSTPELLLERLRTFASHSVIVCVGHEPLLGEITSLLLCGHRTQSFPMKKSAAALIALASVHPGLGQLRWWMEPAQLRLLGKEGRKDRGRVVEESED